MSIELEVALISAAVGLLSLLLNFSVTRAQTRAEVGKARAQTTIELNKLLASFKSTLYEQRLKAYPEIFRVIGQLSHIAPQSETAARAGQVAQEINAWLYSAGGMCAEAQTRGAIIGLRKRCLAWSKSQDQRPEDFYVWRNTALFLLRRDIDVEGLENYDPSTHKRLLDDLSKLGPDELSRPGA